jgi:hypothetical protein
MMDRFLRSMRKLCIVTVIVGLLNFVLFLAGTSYFGGDAVNGKVERGRYYLWGYHHGVKGYTEVSQAVYNYSRWHTYSMLATWSLMILAGFACSRIDSRLKH